MNQLFSREMKVTLNGMHAGRAMLTDFRTVLPRDYLKQTVGLTLAGSHKDFPVQEDGSEVGVLTQSDMSAASAQR